VLRVDASADDPGFSGEIERIIGEIHETLKVFGDL
jgi:hypothetical protein